MTFKSFVRADLHTIPRHMNPISNRGLSIPTVQVGHSSETNERATDARTQSHNQNGLLSGLQPRTKKAQQDDAHPGTGSSLIPRINIVDTGTIASNPRNTSLLSPGLNHQFLSAFDPGKVQTEADHEEAIYHDLQPLDGRHIGEEHGAVFDTKVAYLSSQERIQYKITVSDGLVCSSDGKPIDTRDIPLRAGKKPERAIYVMDRHGNIYLSKSFKKGVFHHSSFLSGQPVAAAGEIRIEHGRVTDVSRTSGHYQPTSKQLDQFTHQLSKLGVPLTFKVQDEVDTPAFLTP